jgi:pSer/pThr/pTyr-binding forkhead associated (FHA) protein
MVYSSADRLAQPLEETARARQETAFLLVEGKRMALGEAGVTVGRSRQCDVVIDDPNVSRRHAELRPRGGSWVLTDLGSTNGSRVNGRTVSGPTVVKPGDEIELGTALVKFDLA